jgi:hypothetical protein
VILQFWNLAEQWEVINRKKRDLVKKVDDDEKALSREDIVIRNERRRIVNETIANLGYLPMTVSFPCTSTVRVAFLSALLYVYTIQIHWSLENSRLPDVAIGLCGTIAAISQLRGAWKATA